MTTMTRTRVIITLPIATCAIWTLVLFADFMALQHYDADYTLHGEYLQTPTDKNETPSRLLASNKLALSLARAPVGQLGPAKTRRNRFRYYDSLFYTSLQFGKDATSLIEVGCASDPFIKYLDWVYRRTCVAPYWVKYGGGGDNANTELDGSDTTSGIESIVADFMEFKVEDYSYDLLICSQVVEHVPDPSAFVKKLIRTAKTSIISVPFEWPDCGKQCNHKTDEISYEMLLKWSEPHVPIFSSIVKEKKEGSSREASRRIIVVFQPEEL
jgi:hypothetical protein